MQQENHGLNDTAGCHRPARLSFSMFGRSLRPQSLLSPPCALSGKRDAADRWWVMRRSRRRCPIERDTRCFSPWPHNGLAVTGLKNTGQDGAMGPRDTGDSLGRAEEAGGRSPLGHKVAVPPAEDTPTPSVSPFLDIPTTGGARPRPFSGGRHKTCPLVASHSATYPPLQCHTEWFRCNKAACAPPGHPSMMCYGFLPWI